MQGSITIRAEPARAMIEVTIAGFLDAERVHAYIAERADTLRRLGTAPNAHLSLYDLSAAPIQSQAVMALFRAVVEDRRFASRRLAFHLGRSAIGMQIRRIVRDRDAVACFDTRAAAEDWLFREPDARAA